MAKATKAAKPNPISRFVGYIGGVRTELKRVVWPTRTEVMNSSLVVMVTLGFFVLFTFLIDSIAVYVVRLIGRIGG